jgi:flagellar motor switch protein FliN/FliY
LSHDRSADAPSDVELSPFEPRDPGAALLPARLAAFSGVKAVVKVVAGEASATVGELLSLKEGAVMALDRELDAPFDIVLDGVVLARGQLVAVGDRFGVRIVDVCMRDA